MQTCFFFKSPDPIFSEFDTTGKSVLITDHAYDAEYDQSATSGQYCVQFMTFVRDKSETVRAWWADRCIEWCYSYKEAGKFGDQKYLDDWPTRFVSDVHVLHQKDALLAPWNAKRFPFSSAIAWHFHGLKLVSNKRVILWKNYKIPSPVIKNIYEPYIRELSNSISTLESENFTVKPQGSPPTFIELSKYLINGFSKYYMTIKPFHMVKLKKYRYTD